MSSQLPIRICQPGRAPSKLAERRQDTAILQSDHYSIHYLTAYLGAVIGGLSQRGIMIQKVELTPRPQPLGCSITFDPPRQQVGFSAPALVAHHASWNEYRGWSCHLHHIAKGQSDVLRYLGEPLVPPPELVIDFIVGLSRVQALGNLGPARPSARCRHTAQELVDDLSRFTPTCTWIG